MTTHLGSEAADTGLPPSTSVTVLNQQHEQHHPRNEKTALRHRLRVRAKQQAEDAKQVYRHVHDDHQTMAHRFLAYLGPLGPTIKTLVRYVAYSSDIGEAFRPVVHKNVVRGAYALSWTYLGLDAAYDTWDKYTRLDIRGGDLVFTGTKRITFQTLASMLLPAFTIHSVVDYSKKYVFQKRYPQYLRWGPTISGLVVVPMLPFMFDEPVEVVCELVWFSCFPISESARTKLKREEALHHGHAVSDDAAAAEGKAAAH